MGKHPVVRGPAGTQAVRGKIKPRTADRRAVSSLEFALVAPLLLSLMLMILETGIMLFSQSALDTATADAGRLIRTGQVQLASNGQSLFSNRLCGDLASIARCAAFQVRVQSANSFTTLSPAVTLTTGGGMAQTGFSPGTQNQFVLVQVAYQPAASVPLVGAAIRAAFGPLLVSTVAFQNEAY